jgi:hypothetical protein
VAREAWSKIGRKDDSWQKPACAHSAHRRGIFHSRSRTKVTTLPTTGSGATCSHVSASGFVVLVLALAIVRILFKDGVRFGGERPGECWSIRPAALRGGWRWFSFSGGLQLAQFVAVLADGRFPLRSAIDVASAGNVGLQRLDTLGLGGGGHRGNASSLAGFYPCLPQCPCEALAANVVGAGVRLKKRAKRGT